MKRRVQLNAIASLTPSPRHLRSGKILKSENLTSSTVSPFFEEEKPSEAASTLNSKKTKGKGSSSSKSATSKPILAVEVAKVSNLVAKKAEVNSKKKKEKISSSEILNSIPVVETSETQNSAAKNEETNSKKTKRESPSSLKSETSNSTLAVETTETQNLSAKKEETNSKNTKRESPSSLKSETSSSTLAVETTEKEEVKKKRRSSPVKIEYEDAPERKDKWMPAHWEMLLDNIKEMRKGHTAPVDDLGCHKCADPEANPKVSRFQNLLALMLSSQTKDQVTHAAMQKLIQHGCTPEKLSQTSDRELADLIYPVSFYKRKAEYIKKTIRILNEKYNGDIPKSIEGLCQLPGVGPKMGHICMQIAWGEVSGIGVDTHVHRICNRLQWVKKATKTPEETRLELEDWLPKELWTEVNALLVGFGQEICLPRFPKCNECLNKDICPFVRKGGNKKI